MTISVQYLAGFFDGEGCVSIKRHKNRSGSISFYLWVNVGQVDPRVIQALKEGYGGSIYVRKTPYGSPLFVWTIVAKMAERFLKEIQPYCIVKSEQIKLGLAFQAIKRGKRIKIGQTFKNRIQSLNSDKGGRKDMTIPDGDPIDESSLH